MEIVRAYNFINRNKENRKCEDKSNTGSLLIGEKTKRETSIVQSIILFGYMKNMKKMSA